MHSLSSQVPPCSPATHRLIPLFMLVGFALTACAVPPTSSTTPPKAATPATEATNPSTEDPIRETVEVQPTQAPLELPHLSVAIACIPTCVGPACADDTCDGTDNDCDGQIDEDYVPQPTRCGLGQCTANGMRICAKGVVIDTCEPGTPIVDLNLCDGIDDDCDGAFNEAIACDDGVACTTDSCNPIDGTCAYDDSDCPIMVTSCLAPGKDGAATRCGQYDPNWTCQCDTMCDEGAYGDCCEDYAPECTEPCGINRCENGGSCSLCDTTCTPEAAPTCYAESCPDITAGCDDDDDCGIARRCMDRCNTDDNCLVSCLDGLDGQAMELATAYMRCGAIHCGWIAEVCASETCVGEQYFCGCPEGWEGEHCEIPAPCGGCQNDGICTPEGCACVPGFLGEHCEVTVNTCWPGSCGEGETCITAPGNRKLCICGEDSQPDCDGNCRPANVIGDGTCDPHFNCGGADYDGGDCCPSGTILSCDGTCEDIMRIGDGQCDAFFACDAFDRDHDDCRRVGQTCGNADNRCASGICGTYYGQEGICVACEANADCAMGQICEINTIEGVGSAGQCVDDWSNAWIGGSCNADGWLEEACLVGTCQTTPEDAVGTCLGCLDHNDCGVGHYCAAPVVTMSTPFEDGSSTYRAQSCQPMPRAGERCLVGPSSGDAEWVPCHESTCQAVDSLGTWICGGCDGDTDCAEGQSCGDDHVCGDAS